VRELERSAEVIFDVEEDEEVKDSSEVGKGGDGAGSSSNNESKSNAESWLGTIY